MKKYGIIYGYGIHAKEEDENKEKDTPKDVNEEALEMLSNNRG